MTPDKAKQLADEIICTIATLKLVADELMLAYPDSDYRDDEPSEAEPQKISRSLWKLYGLY